MSDFLFENPALESVSAGSRYLPENEEVKEERNLSFFFSFICIDLSSSVQSPIPRLASNNSGQR